ncbi:DNA replication/repair protein RecF [Taibaiella sp. KBW10]|uniref:DNA replication/repair protein RecF n=1 Tax=Taibaiella sp. KBW10 TaxID=2153357 RepID=UPI00131524B8|nr:DNA replication and repair protein RecF [Taibaiella sp. KBW10]
MSFLSSISLTQFRNYGLQSFDFDAKVIGITGNNGIGKTNLLDAIYYLCFTKSYFQSKEIHNVQQGLDGFRIEGAFLDMAAGAPVATSIVWKEGKKKIMEKGILVERVTSYIGKHTALMIAPDDIALINGASDVRRKFIDGLLSQADRNYLEQLLAYQKVLTQRNAYLKQVPAIHLNHDLLDVYDNQLAQSGTYLMQQRIQFSNELPVLVQSFYQQLAQQTEAIDVVYKPCIHTPEQLKALLQYNRARDIEARRTTAGLHTEDWALLLNEHPYKTHASQGQKKSMLISMKLAQLEWLRQLGKSPIVLLDDIFEKLDQERLSRFFALLHQLEIPQIFMTHTNTEELRHLVHAHFSSLQMITL